MDWKSIDPHQFEHLCYLVLEANGFTQIEWFGKGGCDKGRDLVDRLDDPSTLAFSGPRASRPACAEIVAQWRLARAADAGRYLTDYMQAKAFK